MKTLKSFPYMGNKSRYVKYIRSPPKNTERVVELYLGSGAYFLNKSGDLQGLGFEYDKNLCELWWWLQKQTKQDIEDLAEYIEYAKTKFKYVQELTNDYGLEKGAELFVRICCCGWSKGVLENSLLFKEYKINVKVDLDKIKQIEVLNKPCSHYNYREGDLVFIDPPYIDTYGNYQNSGYHPDQTRRIIKTIKGPIIFTYGDNCTFPEYHWQKLGNKAVGLQSGESRVRGEYITYINW